MVSLNPQVPFVLGNGMESQLGELFHGAVCPSRILGRPNFQVSKGRSGRTDNKVTAIRRLGCWSRRFWGGQRRIELDVRRLYFVGSCGCSA
jgi:hypothetical protein